MSVAGSTPHLRELRDVVDLWVDAAMNLDEQDLRKIERLRAAQAKRIGLT